MIPGWFVTLNQLSNYKNLFYMSPKMDKLSLAGIPWENL